MNYAEVLQISNEFLTTCLLLVGPAVGTSLIVGLLISIFQTVTSIQEQTLTFAPRIVAVAIVMALTAGWTLTLLVEYTQGMFMRILEVAS